MSLNIGVIDQPQSSPFWPQIQAYLTPAAERGGLTELLGEHELCWGVVENGELLAALTGRWLDQEKQLEVILVGGRDHRRWLKALSEQIENWGRIEGATCLRAYGRAGWARVLGWNVIGREGDFTAYEREL